MRLQVAFYKGRERLFNRAVSWWKRGPYSHCELILGRTPDGDAQCFSSSFMDGGVRGKVIALVPDHWDIVDLDVSAEVAVAAATWFADHAGQKYDVAGLVGFVWGPWAQRPDSWFCNEAVGAALGLQDAWRFDPNALAAALRYSHQEANRII